jgi:Phage P22-like portal protein
MSSNDDHKEKLERFETYWEADRNNREDALEDLDFAAGDQWPETVRQQRETAGRPVVTINNTGQFIRQISGELRQSEPAIEPIPVDDNTDPMLADIYSGLIRQVEYQNSAQSIYTYAAEQAITCGIGHWQLGTKYSDDDTFNQDITIKRILDPLAVVWDSNAVELNRDDAMECFVTEWVSKDAYKRQFKTKTTPTDFPIANTYSYSNLNWNREDRVRIASRWFKVPVKKKIALLKSGEVIDLSRVPRDMMQFLDIARERDVESFDIKHERLSGDDVLDAEDWAGKNIPVVPVIGNEICVNGRIIRFGLVRWLKDPARLYNYFRSAAAEVIATQIALACSD